MSILEILATIISGAELIKKIKEVRPSSYAAPCPC